MARRKKGDKINGWINLNKPLGLTSTQAMAKVRKALNAQKAGHAGTLDPLASGVLPIALGEATKTIQYMQDSAKTYSFTVGWGEQRSTDDSEGEVIATSNHRPTAAEIEAALPAFTGDIEQIPPQFSAVKIDGQRAYALARKGEDVDIKPRQVTIYNFEILSHSHSHSYSGQPPLSHVIPSEAEGSDPSIASQDPSTPSRSLGMTKEQNPIQQTTFRVECGKGTYIRSLARDLALKLGTCGYIKTLTREAVGPFTLEDTISLDKLSEMDHSAALNEAVLLVDSALDDIPVLSLTIEEQAALRNGQRLSFHSRSDFHRVEALLGDQKTITALAVFEDTPIGLIEIQGAKIKPVRLLNL